MQSRKDQLQAHLFTVGRLVSGLTHGEPDAPETPTRRFTSGLIGSSFLGMVVVAAVAVIGLLAGSGSAAALRTPGTLIVDTGTGGRFLMLGGELRPVVNYTSALLITGNPNPPVDLVSAATLRGIRHGQPVGIPGAPEVLPPATSLTTGAWSVCSAAPGQPVQVNVGSTRGITPLNDGQGLLVRTPDGATSLVWRGHSYRIQSQAALTALGYQSVTPVPAGAGWLGTLPPGPPLAARAIPGLGGRGPRVGGQTASIGQVFETQGLSGGEQFSVLLAGGLSPLSRTDAALLLGDPATQAAYPGQQVAAIAISTAALAAAPQAGVSSVTAGFPPTPPRPVTAVPGGADAAACYTVAPGHGGPTIQPAVGRALPPGDGGVRVSVPPGGGLLATPVSPTGQRGPLYLITDAGLKFTVPSTDIAATLGYQDVPPAGIPAALLDLLPTGPSLDPAIAGRTVG